MTISVKGSFKRRLVVSNLLPACLNNDVIVFEDKVGIFKSFTSCSSLCDELKVLEGFNFIRSLFRSFTCKGKGSVTHPYANWLAYQHGSLAFCSRFKNHAKIAPCTRFCLCLLCKIYRRFHAVQTVIAFRHQRKPL